MAKSIPYLITSKVQLKGDLILSPMGVEIESLDP